MFAFSLQVLLSTILFIAAPPETMLDRQKIGNGDPETVVYCSFSTKQESALTLIYPMILMLVTLGFAYAARKAPDGFNEARFITICAVITFTSNLALIPAFYVTTNFMAQHAILDFDVLVAGFAFLGCMFVPKVVGILKGPEKNTRQAVMSRKRRSWNSATDAGEVCPIPNGPEQSTLEKCSQVDPTALEELPTQTTTVTQGKSEDEEDTGESDGSVAFRV